MITTSANAARSARGRARGRSTPSCRTERDALGHYLDNCGRRREILARPGCAGSVLILDCDARTLGDKRLVAHLEADEPAENAALVCRHYLRDPRGRWCRPMVADDLRAPETSCVSEADGGHRGFGTSDLLVDRYRCGYRIGLRAGRFAVPDLRWMRVALAGGVECVNAIDLDGDLATVSVRETVSFREVVASMESYEPARTLTVAAVDRHAEDRTVSVAALRAELLRMDGSRIVLNRGLREAVIAAVEARGLSMSEIARRCGRVKRDAQGNVSGEASWLTRRIGLAPERSGCRPTPWVHSEVLALIARTGLGISPHEVELG